MSIHSRDTAVVIFKTRGADGRPEYRVSHVKHPGALTKNPNYPSARDAHYNREAALSPITGLGLAWPIKDPDTALKRALELQAEMPHVLIEDYSIIFMDFGCTYFPATDKKRAARRRRRGCGRLPPQISAPPSQRDEMIELEFIENS